MGWGDAAHNGKTLSGGLGKGKLADTNVADGTLNSQDHRPWVREDPSRALEYLTAPSQLLSQPKGHSFIDEEIKSPLGRGGGGGGVGGSGTHEEWMVLWDLNPNPRFDLTTLQPLEGFPPSSLCFLENQINASLWGQTWSAKSSPNLTRSVSKTENSTLPALFFFLWKVLLTLNSWP